MEFILLQFVTNQCNEFSWNSKIRAASKSTIRTDCRTPWKQQAWLDRTKRPLQWCRRLWVDGDKEGPFSSLKRRSGEYVVRYKMKTPVCLSNCEIMCLNFVLPSATQVGHLFFQDFQDSYLEEEGGKVWLTQKRTWVSVYWFVACDAGAQQRRLKSKMSETWLFSFSF